MAKKYTCPVCGYDKLIEPPDNFNICPCCSTEFEYSDALRTHEELRENWIKNGMKWVHVPAPRGWNPENQLKKMKGKHGTTKTN